MKIKNLLLNSFAATVSAVANFGAGTNCIGLLYQPKFPGKK